ncbi:glycerol ethanol, ferric requiring protein, partial [Nowakowskiella sp. JEL0078]
IPSMVWGALFGRALGISVESWREANVGHPLFSSCHPEQPCVTAGMYALLGAIGSLGGVTRLTLSLTVIMFELTGTLNYIVPCMVTLMCAKLVGDFFGKGGYTDILIRWKRFPYLDVHDEELVGLSAEKVMTSADELVCFKSTGMSVEEIEQILEKMDFKGYPVVQSQEDKILLGYISRKIVKNSLETLRRNHRLDQNAVVYFIEYSQSDVMANSSVVTRNVTSASVRTRTRTSVSSPSLLIAAMGPNGVNAIDLSIYVDFTPSTIHPKVPVERVMDIFKKIGPRYVLVQQSGRLKGLITKKDLLMLLYGDDEEMMGWYSPPINGTLRLNPVPTESDMSSPPHSQRNSYSNSFETSISERRQLRSEFSTQPISAAQVMRARQQRQSSKIRADAAQEEFVNGGLIGPSPEGIVHPLMNLNREVIHEATEDESSVGGWSWVQSWATAGNSSGGESQISLPAWGVNTSNTIVTSVGAVTNSWKESLRIPNISETISGLGKKMKQSQLQNEIDIDFDMESDLEDHILSNHNEDTNSVNNNEFKRLVDGELLFENPFK